MAGLEPPDGSRVRGWRAGYENGLSSTLENWLPLDLRMRLALPAGEMDLNRGRVREPVDTV